MTSAPPVALTIAGSDCSAGAGIQADLKTFQHFGVHGLTALTCVVAESATLVVAVHAVPVALLRDQLELLLDAFPVVAVKTGMLFSAAHVAAVAQVLAAHPQLALVVDPVMIASTGAPLLEPAALLTYREELLPLARLITPNLPEAEALLGMAITNKDALIPAARRLAEIFGTSVLLKGGHLDGPDCLDLLVTDGEVHQFSAPRLAVAGSHGTGCTLSAAVTAGLAQGATLVAAVAAAKSYLNDTLRHSYEFSSPGGGTIHALNQATRPLLGDR
ncbi:MAG: bifunctional hydroxymethylpyrimidine kinase/phosphomethylpyrimidine kinase [Verrucomicrobia bacterium]|nr:MAG: bifunctional hydroxymethylpyrimidine kinase/phosphomethylpyrimidine kinase [Verrucomicrobiota bacterium]